MNTTQIGIITNAIGVRANQVQNTIKLLEEGGTVPFIARYRKEATGSLDEVQILDIKDLWNKLKEADKRRETIIKAIEEQGKMTPELLNKLNNAYLLQELEDLYLPYKQKRKTRASIAVEKGLEPLAKLIFDQKETNILKKAEAYLNDKVASVDEALQGARDIMAEWINENVDARNAVRKVFEREAYISSKVKKGKEEEGVKYKDYYDFSEPLKKVPSHRLLAIRRGEEEGILSVSISPDEDNALGALDRIFLRGMSEPKQQVEDAITDSYKRLMKPSIENEFSNLSKEKADNEAIRIFAQNLRQLLLASPLGQKRTLAIDPGYRTGCKVVALDAQGNLIADTVIYPFDKTMEAQHTVLSLVEKHKIEAIAIGNGTAGRETEAFVKKLTFSAQPQIFMVSEQGASIYSASEVAREEFPDKDVTVRGAISIGRRLLDPLAELVKIDPKSIGVGQYQHDVDQPLLKNSLDSVVESCVNTVGVNINTASKHLLSYVAGLGPSLAANIVRFRKENGDFKSRAQIKKVPRLGDKAFEQCAGFLRIPQSDNPLDNSAVHPETYPVVERMAKDLKCTVKDLMTSTELRKKLNLQQYISENTGLLTLQDILKELEKPSRDPREQLTAFEFDANVKTIEDLYEGMVLPGIVTNITAFGCFVDVGVKQDGLVHISQLANQYVSDPNQVVKLQQQVQVRVVEVDIARKRIALSMKAV
ncbi:Tex family protein [Flectobacillus longus]|uniref:Tex family protein n=1 Tax=Flectobacillus longus TaxID=2984207 RepID=UPI0024B66DAF|nr:Tex family protein [Flectobacillus longus]MDI9877953.1 Tex family protein [Flectobacillus longus]